MTTPLTAMLLAAITYSGWLTVEYYSSIQGNISALQKQLVLERRVEELARTRSGAISNAYTCHLRP